MMDLRLPFSLPPKAPGIISCGLGRGTKLLCDLGAEIFKEVGMHKCVYTQLALYELVDFESLIPIAIRTEKACYLWVSE